jgi:hypothetical protein
MNFHTIDSNINFKEWTSRYEQLRRTALSEYQSNNGNWGMTLFIRQGMAGWMRAWPKADAPTTSPKYPSENATIIPTAIPTSLREQITILLANMILNGRKEVAL